MTTPAPAPVFLRLCPEKWRLWQAWHETVTPFLGEWSEKKPAEREQLEAEHQSEPYQQALKAYREHLASCELCKLNAAEIAGTI